MKKKVGEDKKGFKFRWYWILGIVIFLILLFIFLAIIGENIPNPEENSEQISTSTLEAFQLAKAKINNYTLNDCNAICYNYSVAEQRDSCLHDKETESCDSIGAEGGDLDNFVNTIKLDLGIPLQNSIVDNSTNSSLSTLGIRSKTFQYTLQHCYDECENYATTTQRDLCMHSTSTQSCDLYGKPSTALDDYVNRLKQYFALQNNPATPPNTNCSPPSSGGDYGVPLGGCS